MAEPRIWALLGQHAGDNNQVLALAEALGLPFEAKPLQYNHWRHLRARALGASTLSLTRESLADVSGEPPDLVIASGIRSVPVVQWLRRKSAGRTLAVHVGYPRISPGKFDLVVATPEYPICDHQNLLRIPFALTRSTAPGKVLGGADFPRPRRLLIIGGATLYWSLPDHALLNALRSLLGRAARDGGSVLVVGSPRTPRRLLRAIEREIESASVPAMLAPLGGAPSYDTLLRSADEIFVSADSVAMISDAIVTGKPVGLIPIERSWLGRIYFGMMDRLRPGRRGRPRDLRFFWTALENGGFAGTLDQPKSNYVPGLTADIAARVRALLRDRGLLD